METVTVQLSSKVYQHFLSESENTGQKLEMLLRRRLEEDCLTDEELLQGMKTIGLAEWKKFLEPAMEDAKAGRMRDGESVFKELTDKYFN